MVWLFLDLVLEDVMCEDALLCDATVHEINDFGRLRQSTTGILEIMGYVVFGVDVGSERCSSSSSNNDGY